MRLSRASEPAIASRTLSGELTLTEAALRVDLSGARTFTVVDHRGRPIGSFDASLLNAIPLVERATLLVSDVARLGVTPPSSWTRHPMTPDRRDPP